MKPEQLQLIDVANQLLMRANDEIDANRLQNSAALRTYAAQLLDIATAISKMKLG